MWSVWTYYTFDPQGNVLNKLDASEGVTAGRLLDAWGQGVETTLPRNIDPWGYNAKWGYYYDRETALYLCQHRMYDASAGRWLNRDPIGLDGGMNLYGYCAGGPVGAVDPWGLIAPALAYGIGVGATALGTAIAAWIFRPDADSAADAINNIVQHFRQCEPVATGDQDLGSPPDWENAPLPKPPGTPRQEQPVQPTPPPPKRESNPRTREEDYRDMVNRLQPDRPSKQECYADFEAASKAIGKAWGSGRIGGSEAARLHRLASENYTRCMSRAGERGDF